MVRAVRTYSLIGIDAHAVDVESDISLGLPAFTIVGLPENTVKESKERIRAAIKNSKLPFPEHRITINLAPADLKKEGTSFDLPIALSIVAHGLGIGNDRLARYLVAGELSLTGEIRETKGALSSAFLSKRLALDGLLVPAANAREIAPFIDIPVYPVGHILEVAAFLKGEKNISPFDHSTADPAAVTYPVDFADVAGQYQAKRAIEIAAAGRHNILVTGPPGSGKTMMAVRLPTILPPQSLDEALETTMIYSAAGMLDGGDPVFSRPFRAPHHTASEVAIVGGGTTPRPGEISLAHNGVLFLDEFPEFKRPVIEALRQPLEDGVVHVSRASMSVTFPADFLLVAAMNPCPCGNFGDDSTQCACSLAAVQKYRKRLSGPILDRIDIHIEVPRVAIKDIDRAGTGERSAAIAARVAEARTRQEKRYGRMGMLNGRLTAAQTKRHCVLDDSSRQLLHAAAERFRFSARSYTKILKLARTIADLEGANTIAAAHVAEAVQLRGFDKQGL